MNQDLKKICQADESGDLCAVGLRVIFTWLCFPSFLQGACLCFQEGIQHAVSPVEDNFVRLTEAANAFAL